MVTELLKDFVKRCNCCGKNPCPILEDCLVISWKNYDAIKHTAQPAGYIRQPTAQWCIEAAVDFCYWIDFEPPGEDFIAYYTDGVGAFLEAYITYTGAPTESWTRVGGDDDTMLGDYTHDYHSPFDDSYDVTITAGICKDPPLIGTNEA